MSTVTREGNCDWHKIVEAVRAKHPKIKNFLTVRGHLQALINAGLLHRTDNIHQEVYVLGPK
jgi:hypothetical protein